MDELPKRTSDRIKHESYLCKGEVRIWNGSRLNCKHNKRIGDCIQCKGPGICEHNKRKRQCRECNVRGYVCIHDKVKSKCSICDGTSVCEHGKEKYYCFECGGSGACEHNKRKGDCIQCNGPGICEHNKIRRECKDCGGSRFCVHNRRRTHCRDCGGGSFCEHDIMRNDCMECAPNNAIAGRLRTRIRSALKNNSRTISTNELIGCEIENFKEYLENMFEVGMSWENYGEWHIDHRKPCASFDLSNPSQQVICFHYTNLQPMWAAENISKNDSFVEEKFNFEWNGSEWIKNT